jgi:carboxyl-terminal processing protease
MRRLGALLLWCTAAAPLAAAPLPGRPAAEPADAARQEPQVFAQLLLNTINQVGEFYVRPVSRADLAHAALSGLYEAARVPRPRDLRRRVERAVADQSLIVLFRQAREAVGDAEALRGRSALLVCCQALARSLDPYSDVVLGPEQRRTFSLEQEAVGVGLEIAEPGGGPLVVRVVHPGGPAQRAGLRPGDELQTLNGQPAGQLTAEQALRLLTAGPPAPEDLSAPAEPPPPLELTYRRRGEPDPAAVRLERQRYRPEAVLGVRRRDDNSWDFWVDERRRLAHVRLATLSFGTSAELRDVLEQLAAEGLQGLILDLRWCGGGYLDEALDTTRLFLAKGRLAVIKGRGRDDVEHRAEDRPGPRCGCPLVVLVNGDTVGGSELIAAALQDNGRALVLGQRTRGKGSVQTMPVYLNVPQAAGLKLTSGTFERPSGRNLHRFPDSGAEADWGVRPDVEFRVSADLDRTLAAWWLRQTLRPGPSAERLPLDDPHADPCREAALAELLRRVESGGAAEAQAAPARQPR